MSGTRGVYPRDVSRVLGERNADPVGEICAMGIDGRGETQERNTAREMQSVRENARATAGFFASVPALYGGHNAKGRLDVSAGGNGVWTNNGRNIK